MDKVWSQIECTQKNGEVLKFIVQDCPKNRHSEVVDLYNKYFMIDESTQKLSGVATSKEAQDECKEFLKEMLEEEGLHIAVCLDASGKMVGASCMQLTTESKDLFLEAMPHTKEVIKLFEIIGGMTAMYNVRENYAAEKCYDGRGIIVDPRYRGFGIGSALVQSRRKICKEHGVPITSAWMTSIGTQKAAHRDGWETPFEIDSREFASKFDVTPYDGISPTFKVMVGRV